MPRKNPVPEREKEICARLREFRLRTKLTQSAFARELGLDSTKYASYELGRVPLKYDLVRHIGALFDLNQRWLAEGLRTMRPYIDIPPEVEAGIPPKELFSVIYDSILRPHVIGGMAIVLGSGIKEPSETMIVFKNLLKTPGSSTQFLLPQVIKGVMARLNPDLHREYVNAILEASIRFEEKVKKKKLDRIDTYAKT